MPTERLRRLEVDANSAFEQYREMYFEGGVSSVYLWDLEHGFAGNISTLISRQAKKLLIIFRKLDKLFKFLLLVTRCNFD